MVVKSIARWGMAPVLALAVLGGGPAQAHHSFRAYDLTKSVAISATIKEFRWGAPHSSLIVMYKDANGQSSSMSLGSGSPTAFIKQGFQPRDFHIGDKVQVVYHPNVSGLPGGFMAKLTTADGRTYSDMESGVQAPPQPAGPKKP